MVRKEPLYVIMLLLQPFIVLTFFQMDIHNGEFLMSYVSFVKIELNIGLVQQLSGVIFLFFGQLHLRIRTSLQLIISWHKQIGLQLQLLMAIKYDQPLEVLLSIDKVFYHDINKNVKDLVQTGTLILYSGKVQSKQLLSIRIGHYVITLLDHIVIVKSEYDRVVTYFLVIPRLDLVSSITYDKENSNRPAFQTHIRTHCKVLQIAELQTYQQVNDVIDKHWSGYLIKPVMVPDKFQQFICSAGNALERGMMKLSGKMREYLDKKKQQNVVNPRNIQPDLQPQVQVVVEQPEPSKFKKFLSSMNSFANKTSVVISKVSAPVVKKGRQYNDKICQKIDKSDNKVLKYMKDLAAVTNDALSNAYSGAKSAILNKQTLYLTVASQSVQQIQPEITESNQEPGNETYEPINTPTKGLNDSLLNKQSSMDNEGYQERI